ncbi:hypothetical protein LTR36_001723 [Oleoguttula mirabilis]|uniref:Uncharacterized protein n=1 Tax=Oleoguttula mirabilis TaxID=1507867 RepID=A0AAV9JMF5_9PEZI|nr:hypothetical protein LTR36_001723 [Oleoguttula mirabilis]
MKQPGPRPKNMHKSLARKRAAKILSGPGRRKLRSVAAQWAPGVTRRERKLTVRKAAGQWPQASPSASPSASPTTSPSPSPSPFSPSHFAPSSSSSPEAPPDLDVAAALLVCSMISPPGSPFVLPSPLKRSPAPSSSSSASPPPPPPKPSKKAKLADKAQDIRSLDQLHQRCFGEVVGLRVERKQMRREFAAADRERRRAIERTREVALEAFLLGRSLREERMAFEHGA